MNLYICVTLINQLKYLVQDLHTTKTFPIHYLQHSLCVLIQSKIKFNDYQKLQKYFINSKLLNITCY